MSRALLELYTNIHLKIIGMLSFKRSDLVSAALLPKLFDLLGKQSNQNGAIGDAIVGYQKERRERVGTIETELQTLIADRERIDIRVHELEDERTVISAFTDRTRDMPDASPSPSNVYSHSASPHILRLLKEREGFSRPRGVDRKWLDEQLVNKVEGVNTEAALSHGLIELKPKGQIDHEGPPIKKSG
jgi:hypothetical protein